MTDAPLGLELLYPMVTEAIRRAETLEDLGAPGAPAAYLDVSLLEEKIAEALPASDPEGAVARRGAVRAALAARDPSRVRGLVDRFLAEAEADTSLKRELRDLAERTESWTASRFPLAARRWGLPEIRRVTQAFVQQAAPFPIG